MDSALSRAAQQAGAVAERVPGLAVLWHATRNYIAHQSGNQAGSVAFSVVLAMFPLLILMSAGAAFIGQPGDAAALVLRILGFAPPVVRDALQPAVEQVVGQRNQALVAIGFFVTVWAASSGMQSIRTALNRAYGVTRSASFWAARLKVTIFTIVAGAGVISAFSSIVVMPHVWQLLRENTAQANEQWLRDSVRYGSAFAVVSAVYALLYGWLPDIRQRLRTILPGAFAGALMWIAAVALLSYSLRSVAKLQLVYGGFAGAVATLVFLYVCAATLIFGAEINGVLNERSRQGMRRPTVRPVRPRQHD
jgi:membrane protein